MQYFVKHVSKTIHNRSVSTARRRINMYNHNAMLTNIQRRTSNSRYTGGPITGLINNKQTLSTFTKQ